MEEFFEQHRLSYVLGMEMASNETIKQAVMADMGVSFLSRHTIELELQMGRLVVLDVRGLPVIRHWHVAHLANKRLSPTASAFKAFVLARGRELLHDQAPAAPP
jgi:DNA-binding transcriptional LysR family regulator